MKNKVTLYIATHNKTGKKYFGKTTRYFTEEDLQSKYHGSGTYWKRHLKKHGDDVTMEIYGIYNIDEVKKVALQFSKENNIVEDYNIWANMRLEDGLDGGITKEATNKMLKTRKLTGTYISGSKKMVETKRIKDKNGEDIFTKASKLASETMKKEGIYERSALKISKKRKKLGLAKGMKNPKAKIIGIYDNLNNLQFRCEGNFIEICRLNNLPMGPLKQSRLKNIKGIYLKQKPKIKKYEKFTGWYSREIKEQK